MFGPENERPFVPIYDEIKARIGHAKALYEDGTFTVYDNFGSRLADQYATARVDLGFSDAELAGLARSSLGASRAPSDVRADAERDIAAWLEGT